MRLIEPLHRCDTTCTAKQGHMLAEGLLGLETVVGTIYPRPSAWPAATSQRRLDRDTPWGSDPQFPLNLHPQPVVDRVEPVSAPEATDTVASVWGGDLFWEALVRGGRKRMCCSAPEMALSCFALDAKKKRKKSSPQSDFSRLQRPLL